MAVNVIKRTWLQDRMVRPETLNGMAFQEEARAHRFEITGYDSNGNVMAFSGTVTAIFLRPDNTDVPLTGVISNGVAQVTLSRECYQVPGRFGLAIFVNSGNTKTVVYKCIGPVGMTSSGVEASSVVQSVSTLIDRIEAAVNSIPQDYSALNKAVSATCPEMRNGSTGNPGNANSITTKYIIKIDKSCDELILEYIGNTQAKYYIFGYSVFKGVADGTESIVARTTAASFLDYPEKYVQTEPYVIIPVSQLGDYTHIAFVLWAKSDETTNIPLRIATDQNNLRVTFRHASSMGHEEINNRSVKVGVQNASKMASPLKLVHFSDLHRDVNALNRIRASVKYVCPNADNVICTGDIVADTYAEITSWWIPEFMTCIGNHDTASYNGAYNWTALTMAQRDEMYISPFEAYWGIVHTAGTSYYYKDYPTAHIRLIVMDAMLYSGTPGAEATAQTEWLANLLASAITGGLHVIIAIHAPHGGSVPVACSFTKLGQENMYVNVDCNTPDVVINTVATAIGNGLHFIGYICGHTHQDAIWDCTGDRSQLMYNITCAAVDQTAQWENSDQYRSDELDAFNVLTIDTASTTIKILRGGGANTDVALRPRVSMVINYSTGKIITDTYASGTQDAVVYGEAQDLTDAQKAQARANIGAGSAADVSENTADITANANEITSLKSALNTERTGVIIELSQDDLVQGTYNGQGAVVTNANVIRTKGWLAVKSGDIIHFTPGTSHAKQLLFGAFNSNKVYQSDSSWYTEKAYITVNWDGYIIIVFKRGDGNALTPSQYDATTVIQDPYALGSIVGNISDKVDEFADSCFTSERKAPINLYNIEATTFGKYCTNTGAIASNQNYAYTDYIPVTPGKTYTRQRGSLTAFAGRAIAQTRWISCYDSNKNILPDKGSADYPTSFTVPDGVAYLRFSDQSYFDAAANPTIVEGNTVIDFFPYFEPYTLLTLKDTSNSPQTRQNTQDIADLQEQIGTGGSAKCIFTAKAATLAANQNLICCNSCDNKKNEYIELTAKFSTFGELTIAHGKGSYMGGYITITESKIQIYTYNGTLIEEYDHGLTIEDFINVIIYTKNDSSCRSKITIMSSGGDYTASTTRYYSCRAAVLCNATFDMTDVQMKYTVNDAKEDVWVFGDSYISMGDPNRWATQAVQDGHIKMMIHGFGGAMSMNEIVPFRALLDVARPKFIVWALGMNDGDTSSAVNTNWKTCVDEVIATCEAKGITLILATIPNVPNVRNTFKNDYVKSTGLRYVDFAKAVNAESEGAAWYAGMLSSDNTHPTALGAKALMRQFLQDVPEVLYAED